MEFPYGNPRHHNHQSPDEEAYLPTSQPFRHSSYDEPPPSLHTDHALYPPSSQPYRHSSYDEMPPPLHTQVTHVHHSSPYTEEYGPVRDSYRTSPPRPAVDYGYAPPPQRPSRDDYGYAPPPEDHGYAPPMTRPSGADYGCAPSPADHGYVHHQPRPSGADYAYAQPPADHGYAPPQPRPSEAEFGGISSVEHISHHSHHPHLPSSVHHSHQAPEISNKRAVRVYSKAEPNFSLTIRDGCVILARSNPSDPYQHWIKDERFSTKVKDQEGCPSFALVNKATGEALKHSIGASHPVQLIPYKADHLDESVLWTESRDLGDSYRTVRMVNNIGLNVDAFHGDQNHGGVHDGTTIVLWEWAKGDNQRWKIIPYCKPYLQLF